jgi:hypothetical protein
VRNGPKLKNSLMRIDTVSHIYSLIRVGGFWTKMAIYNEVRKKLRQEMREGRT